MNYLLTNELFTYSLTDELLIHWLIDKLFTHSLTNEFNNSLINWSIVHLLINY